MSQSDSLAIDRFRFMEFLLLFKGGFTRAEIVKRFEIGEATASRAISAFTERYPAALTYMGPRKGYVAQKGFAPEYEHAAEDGLMYVMSGKVVQRVDVATYGVVEYSLAVALPILPVSAITRAIVNKHDLSVEYVSTSSGLKSRLLAPHSLFVSGGYWYFRAYDYNSNEYRTFKINRVRTAVDLKRDGEPTNPKSRDDGWNRLRVVKLIPHPRNPMPNAQLLDLGVKDDEVKEITVSEACLGFVLNDLRVDCSEGHRLNCYQYPLALLNRNELMGVDSLSITPGYYPVK